eukprot:11000524-Lingulodinium_polyedra.AAC.1
MRAKRSPPRAMFGNAVASEVARSARSARRTAGSPSSGDRPPPVCRARATMGSGGRAPPAQWGPETPCLRRWQTLPQPCVRLPSPAARGARHRERWPANRPLRLARG